MHLHGLGLWRSKTIPTVPPGQSTSAKLTLLFQRKHVKYNIINYLKKYALNNQLITINKLW